MRKCIRCGRKIDKCNGFVLARDIVNHKKLPRELCGKCVLITSFDELGVLCGHGVRGSTSPCQGEGQSSSLCVRSKKY